MSKMIKKVIITIPIVFILGVAASYFLFPGGVVKFLLHLERRAADLKQKNIDLGGWQYSFLEGGKGEAFVLLHGFGANKDNWNRVAKYLVPHFRVIAPDLPGFGESSRPMNAQYTIDAQVERLDQFVTALKTGPFHLGGNSMGGAIAGAYAAKYRHKVTGLWLVAPGGVVSAQPSELFNNLKTGERNLLIIENPTNYDQLLDFIFVNKPFIPGVVKKHFIAEAIHQQPLNQIIFEQILSNWEAKPLEMLMKDLPIKTLILWGDQDRVLHVSGATILSDVMPQAKIMIMENVGHVPMLENPKASAQALLDFFGKQTR